MSRWHSWLFLTNCETWIMTLRSSDFQSDSAWTTFAILAMFSSRRAMPFLLQYCSFQIKAWLLKTRGLKVPRWTGRRLNVNRWEIASCPPFCLQKTSLSTSLWMGGKGTFRFSWQIRHHDKWKSVFLHQPFIASQKSAHKYSFGGMSKSFWKSLPQD